MHGKNIIGFQLHNSGNNQFTTFNPRTHAPNKTSFFEATMGEIEMATSLARNAFPLYSDTSPAERCEFLKQISKNILDLGETLIETYCNESGLSFSRALAERARTLWQIEVFIQQLSNGDWTNASIDTAKKDRKPNPKPDLRKMLIPLGPVVVFGASNFPLAYSTAGGDTISALAAGCPVIVKSHPMHAGTGELVATAIQNAAKSTKMPEGVFANLNSNTYEAGTILVKHQQIKAVGFTGSIPGGRALFDLANNRPEPIPVFAEMGSTNPVVILPNALKERAHQIAKDLANSITLDSGQFCTNPGLILTIDCPQLDEFTSLLSREIVAKNPSYMLNPQILEKFNANKKLVCKQDDLTLPECFENKTNLNFGQPALAITKGETFLANKTLHLEVFGPFSLLVKCKDEKELETILTNLEGQLTGTIIGESEELNNASKVINALKNRVGRLIFNGVPTGVEVCKSMHHGGPYPATSNSHFTAVGHDAIIRWTRPISYQNWPNKLLPKELQNENPLNILRNIDGEWSRKEILK